MDLRRIRFHVRVSSRPAKGGQNPPFLISLLSVTGTWSGSSEPVGSAASCPLPSMASCGILAESSTLNPYMILILVPKCAAEGFSFRGWGSGGQGVDAKSGHSVSKAPTKRSQTPASVRECRTPLLVGDQ